MEWTDKQHLKKQLFDNKSERIITKFLFFPKCINNKWKWLERVWIKQQMGEEIDEISIKYKYEDKEWLTQ